MKYFFSSICSTINTVKDSNAKYSAKLICLNRKLRICHYLQVLTREWKKKNDKEKENSKIRRRKTFGLLLFRNFNWTKTKIQQNHFSLLVVWWLLMLFRKWFVRPEWNPYTCRVAYVKSWISYIILPKCTLCVVQCSTYLPFVVVTHNPFTKWRIMATSTWSHSSFFLHLLLFFPHFSSPGLFFVNIFNMLIKSMLEWNLHVCCWKMCVCTSALLF